jgi:hypothetical protein
MPSEHEGYRFVQAGPRLSIAVSLPCVFAQGGTLKKGEPTGSTPDKALQPVVVRLRGLRRRNRGPCG